MLQINSDFNTQYDTFYTEFNKIVLKNDGRLVTPDETDTTENNTNEIKAFIDGSYIVKIIAWLKRNKLVAAFERQRKSFITTFNIDLVDGEKVTVTLI